jgi:hypothetical protein
VANTERNAHIKAQEYTDGEVVATGRAEGLNATVKLTAGTHSIRVDAGDQPVNLDSVVVELGGQ